MALAKFMSLLTLCTSESKWILYSSTFYSPHINKYIQINMLRCGHRTALCQQLGCFILCSCHLLILYCMLNIKTVLIFFLLLQQAQSSRKKCVVGLYTAFSWLGFHVMELEINMGVLLTDCVYFIIIQKKGNTNCSFNCGKGSMKT